MHPLASPTSVIVYAGWLWWLSWWVYRWQLRRRMRRELAESQRRADRQLLDSALDMTRMASPPMAGPPVRPVNTDTRRNSSNAACRAMDEMGARCERPRKHPGGHCACSRGHGVQHDPPVRIAPSVTQDPPHVHLPIPVEDYRGDVIPDAWMCEDCWDACSAPEEIEGALGDRLVLYVAPDGRTWVRSRLSKQTLLFSYPVTLYDGRTAMRITSTPTTEGPTDEH